MKKLISYPCVALVLLATYCLELPTAGAQGTAFTYQGQLLNNGSLANGHYDIAFSLFATAGGGTASAGPITNSATAVSNGLFTVTLNFGAGVFIGTNYWLDISVSPTGSNTFTELSPRQALTPSPYAIYSANAGTAATATTANSAVTAVIANSANSVSAGNIVGPIQVTQLPTGVAFLNANQKYSGVNTFANTTFVGTPPPYWSDLFTVHPQANLGLGIAVGGLTSGMVIESVNDTASANNSLEIRANPCVFTVGNVGIGTINPIHPLHIHPGTDRNLCIYAANGGSGGFVSAGMTMDSFNDAGTANEPLEFRGNPIAMTLGNVAIGSTNTTEKLEVDGSDTTVRIRNLNDAVGGFVGNTRQSLQLGMYNPSASIQGVLPSGAKRSFFGFNENGVVGSLLNNFPASPSYRNVLDDGSGNMSIAGSLNLPAAPVRIYSGTNLLLQADTNNNFFAGPNAGNLATSGTQNTAIGNEALESNTSGYYNTANGFGALFQNTSGWQNTASGVGALGNNMSGNGNTASGVAALAANISGSFNAANGSFALFFSTNGSDNTASGEQALFFNTSGSENTADGFMALFQNTSGSNNIALGYEAGTNITNGSYNIDIGNGGSSGDNNIIRIGSGQTATYLAGTVYANGVALTSDRNAKEDFASINSQIVLAKVASLPIAEWNYKSDKGAEHIGPMAQDFHAAFGLNGGDDKHISVVDEGGVALAAIQGLNQKLEQQSKEKDAEIQSLKQSVAELKQMVQSLAEKK